MGLDQVWHGGHGSRIRFRVGIAYASWTIL
jgi:hypothetical protein